MDQVRTFVVDNWNWLGVVVGIIGGGACSWFFSRSYYLKSSVDLDVAVQNLKSYKDEDLKRMLDGIVDVLHEHGKLDIERKPDGSLVFTYRSSLNMVVGGAAPNEVIRPNEGGGMFISGK